LLLLAARLAVFFRATVRLAAPRFDPFRAPARLRLVPRVLFLRGFLLADCFLVVRLAKSPPGVARMQDRVTPP